VAVWSRAILGAVLCIVGVIWVGQGIGIIHGSFMTDQVQWAIYGGAALVVGLAMLSLARRAGRNRAEHSS
jgi:hypothetical protein